MDEFLSHRATPVATPVSEPGRCAGVLMLLTDASRDLQPAHLAELQRWTERLLRADLTLPIDTLARLGLLAPPVAAYLRSIGLLMSSYGDPSQRLSPESRAALASQLELMSAPPRLGPSSDPRLALTPA